MQDAIEPCKTEFFNEFGGYFGFSGDDIDHPAAEEYDAGIKMVPVVMGEELFFRRGDANQKDVGCVLIDLLDNIVFFFGGEVAVDTGVNGFHAVLGPDILSSGAVYFFGGTKDHYGIVVFGGFFEELNCEPGGVEFEFRRKTHEFQEEIKASAIYKDDFKLIDDLEEAGGLLN